MYVLYVQFQYSVVVGYSSLFVALFVDYLLEKLCVGMLVAAAIIFLVVCFFGNALHIRILISYTFS